MFSFKMVPICLCLLVLIFTTEANITKFNNESREIDSSCENITSTCSPLTNDSYSTEFTDNELLSTVPIKTTVTIENVTTVPMGNVTSTTVTSKPEIKKEVKKMPEKNCLCDLTPNACDVNCCCDVDCSKWEHASFSKCIESGIPSPSYGQCISTDIIYKNNTPYPTLKDAGGLLCISKDNFPERNAYIEQEVIRSIQTFEKVWGRKRRYHWQPVSQTTLRSFEKKDIYKYGEPVWKYNNATDEVLSLDLPSVMTSSLSVCQRKKSVSYLKDFTSTCLQLIPRSEEECINNFDFNARNYCQDLILVASPSLVNSSSQFSDSPDDAFLKVKQFQCSNENCYETTLFPEPTYNKTSGLCMNTILKLHFLLIHNGSLGMIEAKCSITLGAPFSPQGIFKQTFNVEYRPANLNSSIIFHRSGTPGYRDGMPVVTNLQKGSKLKVKTSLSVISGDNCKTLTPVLFRENSRIQCTLKIPVNSTLNCTFLEEQIISKMLEGVGEIGVTGDPSSWLETPLPLVTASVPRSACTPASILSLRFLYAYKGPLLRPEAKIVGFLIKFDRNQPPQCSKQLQYCSLRLVTTVSFTDVSRPVISKYASAPVVKIKLPQDFFYPFSSRASNFYASTNELSLALLTLLYMFNAVYLF